MNIFDIYDFFISSSVSETYHSLQSSIAQDGFKIQSRINSVITNICDDMSSKGECCNQSILALDFWKSRAPARRYLFPKSWSSLFPGFNLK